MNKVNEITSRYILPTIEERTSYGYKRLDPYTKLFEERIIFLGQAIDDTVANDVMAQLLTLESMDPDRDIMMYINSPGGSFTALTAIYDTMQFVRPDVMTICLDRLPLLLQYYLQVVRLEKDMH
jgi:ATP-dependent Clp protease protease subunit